MDSHPEWMVGDYRNEAIVYNCDHRAVPLNNMYRGGTAFLIGSGPSLANVNLELFNARGVVSMCMNNSVALLRPQLWCSVDAPQKWVDQLWNDAGIMKFIPISHFSKHTRTRHQGSLIHSKRACSYPSVFGYKLAHHFDHNTFLTSPSFSWGCENKQIGSDGVAGHRSVLLVAIKLLYFLGIRQINLVGIDFNMDYNNPYAFPETKPKGGVKYNNSLYKVLTGRLKLLQPSFKKAGLEIRNCNPSSKLSLFPYIPFEDAIKEVELSNDIDTKGFYH